MANKNYMYAVDRSDEYLAHYGIKGMKWGVRKAIESGNNRALARQYKKASRKLAKLQARAENGKKYARRAALMGAGAAAAGGLALAGTQGVAQLANTVGSKGGKLMRNVGTSIGAATPGAAATLSRLGFKKTARAVNAAGSKVGSGLRKAGTSMGAGAPGVGQAISQWGRSSSIASGAANAVNKVDKAASSALIKNRLNNGTYGLLSRGHIGDVATDVNRMSNRAKAAQGISNNTIARIGAGAVGAGLAAGAGYNAYRAATTKRAARKAAEFQREMNQAFKGTQYANGGNGSRSSGNRKRRRR